MPVDVIEERHDVVEMSGRQRRSSGRSSIPRCARGVRVRRARASTADVRRRRDRRRCARSRSVLLRQLPHDLEDARQQMQMLMAVEVRDPQPVASTRSICARSSRSIARDRDHAREVERHERRVFFREADRGERRSSTSVRCTPTSSAGTSRSCATASSNAAPFATMLHAVTMPSRCARIAPFGHAGMQADVVRGDDQRRRHRADSASTTATDLLLASRSGTRAVAGCWLRLWWLLARTFTLARLRHEPATRNHAPAYRAAPARAESSAPR
jgi:hypothetical protein